MADWVDKYVRRKRIEESVAETAFDFIRKGMVSRSYARRIFDMTPEEEDEEFRRRLLQRRLAPRGRKGSGGLD